jgi:hypothetical protein
MTFENKNGVRLLTGVGTPYTIKEFSGLNPPKAIINTNTTALLDGGIFNSSKLEMRSMNIAFAIEAPCEENRLNVYSVIQSKLPVRVYYKSDMLDIFIDGYVEDLDFSYFAQKVIATVSILCPSTYFKGAQEIINELSAVVPKFHFPFASTSAKELIFGVIDTLTAVTVKNDGNVTAGLTFEIYCKEPVKNPEIIDYATSEFMKINITMQIGDLITITTGQGNKTITLLRGGVRTNIFNLLDKNSTWLQLDINDSVFVYTVDEGNVTDLEITIKHYDLYEGV